MMKKHQAGGGKAMLASVFGLMLIEIDLLISRLYESVVAVLAFVKHADAVGVSIAENKELIGFVGELHQRFFGRHGFHGVASRRDDARLARVALAAVAIRTAARNAAAVVAVGG